MRRFHLPLQIALILLGFWAVERFCHKQTKGFSLLKIASSSSRSAACEIASLPSENKKELDALLDQTYLFLGNGGQCYVFLSQDGKAVIKLFKQHHIRQWQLLHNIPLPRALHPLREKLLKKKSHQSPLFFKSCALAYEKFKERTGLIYLHLNRTNYFNKNLKIIDPLGIAHFIDLDATDFAIQKRIVPSHVHFRKLIRENNLDEAKRCIESLFELIRERNQQGIADRDPNIRRNIGFICAHAIEMDLGSFTEDEDKKSRDRQSQHLARQMQKLQRWLSKENRELSLYFSEKLKSY
ncbi:MAG TPA: hypothetical protein VGJ00_03540 [Rhabdochlamydiaceae bacterium]